MYMRQCLFIEKNDDKTMGKYRFLSASLRRYDISWKLERLTLHDTFQQTSGYGVTQGSL